MRKNQKFTKEQMYAWIESWQQSGTSQNRFCKEEKISTSTFNYWLRKYKQEKIGQFTLTANQDSGLCTTDFFFLKGGYLYLPPNNQIAPTGTSYKLNNYRNQTTSRTNAKGRAGRLAGAEVRPGVTLHAAAYI